MIRRGLVRALLAFTQWQRVPVGWRMGVFMFVARRGWGRP